MAKPQPGPGLGLSCPADVRAAAAGMARAVGRRGYRMAVQPPFRLNAVRARDCLPQSVTPSGSRSAGECFDARTPLSAVDSPGGHARLVRGRRWQWRVYARSRSPPRRLPALRRHPRRLQRRRGCSLRERQDWALRPAARMVSVPRTARHVGQSRQLHRRWAPMSTRWSRPARAQSRDRFFTHVASIAEENAFFNSGSSAGFGIRLTYDPTANRVFVVEAFEGAPALAAGIDRGSEIIAIGTSADNLQTVIVDHGRRRARRAFVDALGPTTAGTTRVLRVVTNGVTSDADRHQDQFLADPGLVALWREGASTMAGARSAISTCAPSSTPPTRRCAAAFSSFRAPGHHRGDRRSALQRRRAGLDRRADGRPARRRPARRRCSATPPSGPRRRANNDTDLFGAAAAGDRLDQDRVHRHDRHRLGQRTGDQRVQALSRRQCRADRHQHLRQAGRPDRARSRGLRRSPARRSRSGPRTPIARATTTPGWRRKVAATCSAADDYTKPLGDPRKPRSRWRSISSPGAAAPRFRAAARARSPRPGGATC